MRTELQAQKSIRLDAETLRRVEKFQQIDHRPTLSNAIEYLVLRGLEFEARAGHVEFSQPAP